MNEKNLKGYGFHERTASEQREIASKGGKASVKARAEKKAVRDIADTVLSMPMGNGTLTNYEDATDLEDMLHSNPSVKAQIIATLAKKAAEGNTKAAELLFTMTGEYSKSVAMQATIVDDESAREIDEYFARKFNGGIDFEDE